MTPYAELVAATNFSFLHGASPAQDLVVTALLLGHAGLGVADRNTVAGVVRAWSALEELREDGLPAPEKLRAGGGPGEFVWRDNPAFADLPFDAGRLQAMAKSFRLVVGARLVFADGTPDIVAYPATRNGWSRLCRLLSLGNMKDGVRKGECVLTRDDLLADARDLLLIVMPGRRHDDLPALLACLADAAPGALWLGACMHRRGDDRRRLARLKAIAASARTPLIATNDVLYDAPGQRDLQDLLTCIREGVVIDRAGRLLEANAERHLKTGAEMARLFRDAPDAIEETGHLLGRIEFDLRQLTYDYPDEPTPPGWTPQAWLGELVARRAPMRYPDGVPDKVQRLLDDELALIAKLDYARYFLTIRDIVDFARSRGILCQGRGSAANSAVCFVLGITAVDPAEHDLLFARFISEERREPPDIDVDFEHERREEVIQHIYQRFGRERAGIAATVIRYRPRSAIRDVGKALGLSADVTARIASTQWGSWGADIGAAHVRQAGLDPENPVIARAIGFALRLLGFPRHLSQHVGGFVLTRGRLDELVPIGRAAMDDRTFIEWDKDDIDALRLMKVDVLALGMLTCIRKAFDLLRKHDGLDLDLADIPPGDAETYAMLQRGHSLGVFQVESRAQMNMLPRLKPKEFYDLVIQVAIVRPGPIQGDMVHPYLRRRNGLEPVVYPSPGPPHDPDELYKVLHRTFGVPLFQEQAMKIAMVAAEFSDIEANRLRKAMATFRNVGTIGQLEELMVGRMIERGYDPGFARRCFDQIKGFGSYGFPESHAASFAKLVYISSWLKRHHPAAFACALLNAQPMGFYAPAQIVREAQENGGVETRPIDVNMSDWDNGLEREAVGSGQSTVGRPSTADCPLPTAPLALRLGLRQIDGFHEDWARRIERARDLPPPPACGGEGRGGGESPSRRSVTAEHARPARPPTPALPTASGGRESAQCFTGRFTDVESLARRARLPGRAMRLLADADAFRSLGLDRREALWAVRRLPDDDALPLFAAAKAQELGTEPATALPRMPLPEHIVADYQTARLSLKGHPMGLLRPLFRREGVSSCAETEARADAAFVRTAGIVLVRQRPGKGNAIFITLEDETGVTNVVLWARLFARFRREVMAARLLLVEGRVQRSPEGVTHLMAQAVFDRTAVLDALSDTHRAAIALTRADEFLHPQQPRGKNPGGRHPRDVRIMPKSRDFH